MTLNPFIKTSSRAGRFKKKLVSPDQLLREAPLLEARLAPLLELFRGNHLSESEFTTLSLIAALSLRYPGTWLGTRRASLEIGHNLPFSLQNIPWKLEENVKRRLCDISNLGELLNSFALNATPLAVNRALLSWSDERYALELFFRIPTPQEVLSQQVRGHRCVTVLTKSHELSRYVLGERDSVSFTMHDLIHADHFYHHNEAFAGQVNFYNFISYCLQQGHFEDHLTVTKFSEELEYLISDMNAYAIHLMKCLKSALVHFHPRGEDFFKSWVNRLDATEEESSALLELNGQKYNPELQDEILLRLFSKFRP